MHTVGYPSLLREFIVLELKVWQYYSRRATVPQPGGSLRYSNYYATQDVGLEYIMISTSGLQSKTNETKSGKHAKLKQTKREDTDVIMMSFSWVPPSGSPHRTSVLVG